MADYPFLLLRRKERQMKDNCFKTIVVDDRKEYICIPDCPFRLVFEDGKYVGWYYCGEREGNE